MNGHEHRERILRITLVFIAVFSIAITSLLYRSTAHAPVIISETGDLEKSGTRAPLFEQYPLLPTNSVIDAAPIDWESYPNAREFQTRITEAYAKGANFADHYTVADWGCGTSCQGHIIVDRTNGKFVAHFVSEYSTAYRTNSRLLVVNPPEEGGAGLDWLFTSYYEIADGQLRLIEKRDSRGELVSCFDRSVEATNVMTGERALFPSSCTVPLGWIHLKKQQEEIVSSKAVIRGRVTIGPLCPVEQEGRLCPIPPEIYTSRSVVVTTRDGTPVARTHFAADGTYQFTLSAGTYILTLPEGQGGIEYSKDLPQTIVLTEGEIETIDFSIDTGIR